MSDETAARPEPVRAPRFGLSGKLLVLTILFVMLGEVLIYVPLVANFRVNWLNDRLASAYTAALVLDAAPNGMVLGQPRQADPQLDRRARGRDEDGQAAPPARGRRHAAADQSRLRHAQRHDLRFDHRRVHDDVRHPQERDARRRPRADGRRLHRNRHGRAAAAQGAAALFGGPVADLAVDLRHHRGAGLFDAALHFRAPDAPDHRQHDGVPRRSGKCRTASLRRRRAPTRSALPSASSRPCRPNSLRCCIRRTGSPRSASPSPRSTTICATCSARRSSSPTGCRACPIRACSASRPS